AGMLPHPSAVTANGQSMGDNCSGLSSALPDVIKPISAPMVEAAGFLNLKGNLFDSAIMKTSVISAEFRDRYLSDADDPEAFEGRAVVFDGPEDFHAKIDDESLEIDEHCILIMRGAGPIGYPGAAEVVNMRPPAYLLRKGIHALPCIGDGRQSGTSGSPSILNASPEAAAGGGLALVQTGDRLRIDLGMGTANMLVDEAVLAQRRASLDVSALVPESETPWQEIFRERAEPLSHGMTLRGADAYRGTAQKGVPRDNH
ncbi:MAG: dihydroxy-acid dehydratase, partial [Pseudomonadota bacterium]